MPALIGTIALLAGCGSRTRAEVTGVVRDARTGRAIPGARVFAQDGSATRTDAEGRFTISISSGAAREIRVSAAGHCDASARLDVRVELTPTTHDLGEIEVEIAPCDEQLAREPRETAWDGTSLHDPDAVLRWIDDVDWGVFRERGVLEPDAPAGIDRGDLGGARPAEFGAREQWALGAMADLVAVADSSVRSGSATECASCHDAAQFAAAHGTPASSGDACATCHDPGSAQRHGLRIYEHIDDIGGAPATGLGSGAICAECHRASPAAIHAPQADVLLGRLGGDGAGNAPHAMIADTCIACHAPSWRAADPETITLGHTFRARDALGEIARDACSACHGDVDPRSIGVRDWDGDGITGALGEEHDRARHRARSAIELEIARARVRVSACGGVASAIGFGTIAGALALRSAQGWIGDCDGDATIDRDEQFASIDRLAPALRDRVTLLATLEADGSRGVHNPAFALEALRALAH